MILVIFGGHQFEALAAHIEIARREIHNCVLISGPAIKLDDLRELFREPIRFEIALRAEQTRAMFDQITRQMIAPPKIEQEFPHIKPDRHRTPYRSPVKNCSARPRYHFDHRPRIRA